MAALLCSDSVDSFVSHEICHLWNCCKCCKCKDVSLKPCDDADGVTGGKVLATLGYDGSKWREMMVWFANKIVKLT